MRFTIKRRILAVLAAWRVVLERLQSLLIRERDSNGDASGPFSNVRQPINPPPGNRSAAVAVSEPDD